MKNLVRLKPAFIQALMPLSHSQHPTQGPQNDLQIYPIPGRGGG